MGMRGACRSLPVLSDRVPILLALGAWLAALWSTEVFLLVMSGALGWATALLSIGDGVVTAEDRP
jgi:hypothetical protein